MALANEKIKKEIDRYLSIYEEVGDLPHHKINLADSYLEGVRELEDYANEMDEVVHFVGFALQDKETKNESTYLSVMPLRENSIKEISDIVKEKLASGRLKTPHIIYGEIDPKTKGVPTYAADDLAEIVAISKALGEEFGALVDVSGHKVSGDGSANHIRYNDTDLKDRVGFFGVCDRKNIQFASTIFGK